MGEWPPGAKIRPSEQGAALPSPGVSELGAGLCGAGSQMSGRGSGASGMMLSSPRGLGEEVQQVIKEVHLGNPLILPLPRRRRMGLCKEEREIKQEETSLFGFPLAF